MAVSPKVSVKWAGKQKGTYSISGNTYAEMFAFFEKRNASGKEWGLCEWNSSYDYDADDNGIVTSVVLKPRYSITLPTWGKRSSAPKSGQKAWDDMLDALEKHENGHADLFSGLVDDFCKLLGKQTDLKPKDLDTMHKDFLKGCTKESDAYDAKTDHGMKTGVELPNPDKIK